MQPYPWEDFPQSFAILRITRIGPNSWATLTAWCRHHPLGGAVAERAVKWTAVTNPWSIIILRQRAVQAAREEGEACKTSSPLSLKFYLVTTKMAFRAKVRPEMDEPIFP
jgi:hypothetical protein